MHPSLHPCARHTQASHRSDLPASLLARVGSRMRRSCSASSLARPAVRASHRPHICTAHMAHQVHCWKQQHPVCQLDSCCRPTIKASRRPASAEHLNGTHGKSRVCWVGNGIKGTGWADPAVATLSYNERQLHCHRSEVSREACSRLAAANKEGLSAQGCNAAVPAVHQVVPPTLSQPYRLHAFFPGGMQQQHEPQQHMYSACAQPVDHALPAAACHTYACQRPEHLVVP